MIDVTGLLDEGKKLRFRVNGAYENTQSFRDVVHGFRYFIAPVFTWKASNHTTLSVEGEYIRDRRTPDSGLPAIGTGLAPVPDRRFYVERFDTLAFEEGRAAVAVLHQFNDAWRIESRFRADLSTATAARTVPLAVLANQSLARFVFNQLAPFSSYYWRNDLIGKLSTGSIKHEILTGAELGRQYASYNQAAVPFDTISIFNPVYGQTPEPNLQRTPFSHSFANALGGYVQDQIALPYNLHLLVGARGDYFYQHSGGNGVDTKSENYVFSLRVGVTYQPLKSLSVYANTHARSCRTSAGSPRQAVSLIRPGARSTKRESRASSSSGA